MKEKKYQTILIGRQANVGRISLNRPDVHNAFNVTMIRELAEAFERARQDEAQRLVVLTGIGESFCAGAESQRIS
jgi:enoyl-CoA hydratase/carnithine racemase